MSTLTKADLAKKLVDDIGLNYREAKKVVDSFFDTIMFSLEKGEDVKISGLGNFILRNKRERPGRNPKTGQEKIIKARKVVTFRTSPKLKEILERS